MFSLIDIADLVHKHYQLKVSVKALPGELDLNYYLKCESGEAYILKIANSKEKVSNLELQNAMMAHLDGKQTGLKVPHLIKSVDKLDIVEVPDGEGQVRFMRLFTWIAGRPLANVNPHTESLLFKVGALCGTLSSAFQDFDHPAAHRFLKWNPEETLWVNDHLHSFAGQQHEIVSYFYQMFETQQPKLRKLRHSVTYHDANDYNILVSEDLDDLNVPGVIDFGDTNFACTITELSIAITYCTMSKQDPLTAACIMVEGYHSKFPLQEEELEVLFSLICARLVISVTCAMINLKAEPDNVYLQISNKPAWDLLHKFRDINPAFAYYRFRAACGMIPHPNYELFLNWVSKQNFAPLLDPLPQASSIKYLDLSVGSLEIGNSCNIESIELLDQQIQRVLHQNNASVGIGKYNEVRPIYTTDQYAEEGNDGPIWRAVHIGLDVFAPANTKLYAPLDGEVVSVANNDTERNYGPTIIIKHEVSSDFTFYTLYGHLSKRSLTAVKEGQQVKAGDHIANIGGILENGHWPPHLHFQVMLDMIGNTVDFPGVAHFHQRSTWTSLCPDPSVLLGLTPQVTVGKSAEEIIRFRKQHLGKNLSVSYSKPLKMLRGWRQYLLDETGRRYLDTVNNVAHVGHEHPSVVRAGQQQMAVLNTNTRYLHENILRFAEDILSTMPKELSVVYVVNSGSEANELALRLARNHTNAKDTLVVEIGYHGNTSGCVEVSSYKFDGPGGKGAPPHIHVVPMPDTFRGAYKAEDQQAGTKYAAHLQEKIDKVKKEGRLLAGFICESVLSCGGQIPLPAGYLKAAYAHVRAAGGVCIADEVQTGCGRVGTHFWAFEQHQVVPDIVTIGKPIGNGHPLGVVVTTQAIADSFYNGMEYFNTFGGNPVSSAIGSEVLSIIKSEDLQQNAKTVGAYLSDGLLKLKDKYAVIGDVRGPGLFIGIELVENRETLEPAATKASYLANRMRELGILMSVDGPLYNVLKIKPPLVFGQGDTDVLLNTLDRVLREDYMQVK
ncbi:MAG: aminotransferase class III-fold pyridoxal phosphate-dependent enzyme [Cyclobacteriaceae bacterium]